MINAVFACNQGELNLTIKGHSETMLIGDDPVCAAASVTAWTLKQIIDWHKQNGDFKREIVSEVKSGDARLICKPKRKAFSEIVSAYFFAETAFRILERNFPDKVSVTQFDRRKAFNK